MSLQNIAPESKADVQQAMSDADNESDQTHSDTSSLEWGHVPFETYKNQVLELFQSLSFFFDGEISVERLKGGSYNRVIGVSVTSNSSPPRVNEYILRIPRYDEDGQIESDLAPLQLVRQQANIRIPNVIVYDTTKNNFLENSYMIQRRIPGRSLHFTWSDMPHSMKCNVAQELGYVVSELHAVRSTTAGKLNLSASRDLVVIEPFHEFEDRTSARYCNGPAIHSTVDMLLEIFRKEEKRLGPEGKNDLFQFEYYNSFIAITLEMDALGVLDGDHFSLCHLDLEARNILASESEPTENHVITGILDWDSAIFAPLFMSCKPPMWLWAWNDDGEEDEKLANNIPSTPEGVELKELFEEAAGPDYQKYAYGAEFRLARQLLQIAIDGMRYNEDFGRADMLVKEWAQVRQSLQLQI